MNYAEFKNAKHPSAEMRQSVIISATETFGNNQAMMRALWSAVGEMFDLSENFLYRQYYHRDKALAALDSGDLAEVRRQLNEIGNSGHFFDSGEPVKC